MISEREAAKYPFLNDAVKLVETLGLTMEDLMDQGHEQGMPGHITVIQAATEIAEQDRTGTHRGLGHGNVAAERAINQVKRGRVRDPFQCRRSSLDVAGADATGGSCRFCVIPI